MSISKEWRPTIALKSLEDRARLLEAVRLFFKIRHVLEVETPILGQAPVTDPFLSAMTTQASAFPGKTFYLQTSPEYYQKRLIAAYPISCYQLGKCFRDDEYGRYHSPEFTMLEWYRLGFDDGMLMEEVADLIRALLAAVSVKGGSCSEIRLSYQEAFQQCLNINPHTAPLKELQDRVALHVGSIAGMETVERDPALQLLMSHVIEPAFAEWDQPVFLYDFPASQAALAKIKTLHDGTKVAARFEVYWGGVELGNAYHELVQPGEQRERFREDLKKRDKLGLPQVPMDENLLAALDAGLPECAGIAMGFDRLVMVILEKARLADVQSFWGF